MFAMAVAPVPQDAGLWTSIVQSLPRDPGSIFVLSLVVAGAIAVWLANRKRE
jgi:hypothetical protein